MQFKSWFCSDSKLIYAKKIIEKMNTLISTFHFRLHNSTSHLSNVLKLSRRFETQWNLLCWKYKINEFYFGTNTKSTNLWIHELVIFNQTTKIDTHEEKYFNSMSYDRNLFSFVNHISGYRNCLECSRLWVRAPVVSNQRL
jgi:hypothetical protein